MTKYESKKNPGTFLTTDGVVDEKTKTMAVTMDDGKEKRISVSTLKRWWKKVEELETDQAEEEKVEEEQAKEAKETEAEKADQPEEVKPEELETEQAETKEPETEQAETKEPETEQAETKELEAEEAAQTTKDGVTECHKAAKMLEDIFNTINYIYFEDSLPKSAILVQNTPREYARHTMQKLDKIGRASCMEIVFDIVLIWVGGG